MDPAYLIDLLLQVLEMGLLASSLWLLIQHLGLVSLGHAAFYGLAAYGLVLGTTAGLSLLAASLLGLLMAVGFGLISGLLVLRSRGLAFLMASLAFAQMAHVVAVDTNWLGGSDGIFMPKAPPEPTTLLIISLLVSAAWVLLLLRLARSPYGHVLAAVHQHEDRATSLGISVFRVQLLAYGLSAAMAASAGLLHGLRFGFASPGLMGWQVSGMALLMVLIGGQTRIWSAWLGALVVTLLHEGLSSEDLMGDWAKHWAGGLGLVMMVLVMIRGRRPQSQPDTPRTSNHPSGSPPSEQPAP